MPLSLRFRYMIKYNSKILTKALVPSSFDGYFTIHGECEMDGKRRIKFASSEIVSEKSTFEKPYLSIFVDKIVMW